jgi:hypothetical protein
MGDRYSRQLYQISLETCPSNAKAWGQFAAWSYRQGRKASDWEEEGSSVNMPSEHDHRKLAAILGPQCDENLVASIMAILYERRKTELDDTQLADILNSMLANRVDEVCTHSFLESSLPCSEFMKDKSIEWKIIFSGGQKGVPNSCLLESEL